MLRFFRLSAIEKLKSGRIPENAVSCPFLCEKGGLTFFDMVLLAVRETEKIALDKTNDTCYNK